MNSEYFDSFFTQVVLENSALHIYGRFRHAVPDAVSIRAFRESGGFGLNIDNEFSGSFLKKREKAFRHPERSNGVYIQQGRNFFNEIRRPSAPLIQIFNAGRQLCG